MTDYPPAGERVLEDGQTLSARMRQFLRDSYAAAGLDRSLLVVTQGSYKAGGGAAASGSTHDGAGAADLRTWNLPASAQADLCRDLVVELRKRGGCAWYRDKAHGGFDPHIHVILRDEPGLSSGAAQQVRDYDRGLNGLSNKGPDYHPRPTQTPYQYPPTTAPGDSREDDEPVFIFRTHEDGKPDGQGVGTGAAYLVHSGHAVQMGKGFTYDPEVLEVRSPSEACDQAFYASVTRHKL